MEKRMIIIFLMLGIFISCSEDEQEIEPDMGYLFVRVYTENYLTTGEPNHTKTDACGWLFDVTDKDLEVSDYSDLGDGFIYDKISEQSFLYDFKYCDDYGFLVFNVPPGTYLLAVMEFAYRARYSVKEVTITTDGDVELTKIFDKYGLIGEEENWELE